MIRYVLWRILHALPTVIGILLLTFVTFHVVGGSPAEVILGQHASPLSLAEFEARYGYDKPLMAGRWQRVRALTDWTVRDAADAATALPEAPEAPESEWMHALPDFHYALPAGEYRWRIRFRVPAPQSGGALRMTLHAIEDESTSAVEADFAWRDGGMATAVVTVPQGWRASMPRLILDSPAIPETLELRRRTTGFFDSQFVHFISNIVRGDFGYSVSYGQRVSDVLRGGIGASLSLTIPIFLLTLCLALTGGMVCAAYRGRWPDRSILGLCAVLMSVNYVAWVIGGQYVLAYRWDLFPVWGFASARHLMLPVAIGVISALGRDIRYYRTVVLDETSRPHVRSAISRGLHPGHVWIRHVLRNSLIPVTTQLSLSLPFLFMGSLLLESFFGIPGVGGVSLNAIQSGDMSVVRAVVILGALLYQAVNLATDVFAAWLDPRVRLA